MYIMTLQGHFVFGEGVESVVKVSPAVFAGTMVQEGQGRMLVLAVGANTYQVTNIYAPIYMYSSIWTCILREAALSLWRQYVPGDKYLCTYLFVFTSMCIHLYVYV